MITLVDYFYLTLYRWFYPGYYRATGIMAFTFMCNLAALWFTFCRPTALDFSLIAFLLVFIAIYVGLILFYNKKRKIAIVKRFRSEPRDIRFFRGFGVAVYIIASVAAVFWAA